MRMVRELVVPKINARANFLSGTHDEVGGRSERFAPTIALVERSADAGPTGISHICFRVENIYATCQGLLDKGFELKMPPRDGFRAMVRGPEGAVIEFHQAGERKVPQEPWLSMADGT
jgi:lactoylglutathione lyase